MKTYVTWLVVGLLVGAGASSALAQGNAPEAATQGFIRALRAPGDQGPAEVAAVSVPALEASSAADQQKLTAALDFLRMLVAFNSLPPTAAKVTGEEAAAQVRLNPLELKLMQVDGQWKVDLLATYQALPQALRDMIEKTEAAPPPPPPADMGPTEPAATPAADPVVELNSQNFAAEVTQSKGLMLVDFWATWCGPCMALKPILHATAADYQAKMKFGAVDVDQAQNLSRQFGVEAIPTLILFRDGQKIDEQVGYLDAAALRAWLDKNLGG
ncbi:MAG TPA: thioredoxin [Armatimonadota bacterium]